MWLQQDEAPFHISNATIQYLEGQFPGQVMSTRATDLALLAPLILRGVKHTT